MRDVRAWRRGHRPGLPSELSASQRLGAASESRLLSLGDWWSEDLAQHNSLAEGGLASQESAEGLDPSLETGCVPTSTTCRGASACRPHGRSGAGFDGEPLGGQDWGGVLGVVARNRRRGREGPPRSRATALDLPLPRRHRTWRSLTGRAGCRARLSLAHAAARLTLGTSGGVRRITTAPLTALRRSIARLVVAAIRAAEPWEPLHARRSSAPGRRAWRMSCGLPPKANVWTLQRTLRLSRKLA